MQGTQARNKRAFLLNRYIIATVGMALVAVGIALTIISNLGTAPLSCPAYVAALKVKTISVGTFTWIINMVYMLVQIAVLRRRFKARYWLQIAASILLGYMIDGALALLDWLHPDTIFERLSLVVLSCAVTAVGISMELVAKAWMLSAEMTVNVLSREYGWDFSRVKIIMDSSLVVLSMSACFLFFRNFFGYGRFTGLADVLLARTEGVVTGIGTLISAFLVGLMMKLTTPFFEKIMDRIRVGKTWRAY